MKKTRSPGARSWSILMAAALAISLGGCVDDGDDGAPGPQGPPGPPGQSGVPIESLNIQVTSVSIQSPPVVTLTITDQNGSPVTTFTRSNLRYTMAKLFTPPGETTSRWQNYILRGAKPGASDPGTGPGGTPALPNGAVQGNAENCATLTLTNAATGEYVCVFATDVTNVSCPANLVASGAGCKDAAGNNLDLSYNDNLAHRIAFQVSGAGLPATNAAYDFIPLTGAAPPANDPNFSREMVKTALCNVCHDKLALHGGGRVETKLCVTCHNPGSTDPNSGRTVDFKVMIHKIHYGAELPSVNLGPDQTPNTGDEIPYIIWGFGDNPHNFSDVEFPAGVRSANVATGSGLACSKCHDPTQPDLPQANNALTKPNRQACGACHDDITFRDSTSLDPNEWPDPDPNRTVLHVGGPQGDDTMCATCHKFGTQDPLPGSVEQSHTVWERHYATECYQFEILGVTPQPAQGQTVNVKFRVTNPNPGKILGPDAAVRADAKCANTPVHPNTGKAHYNILDNPGEPAFQPGGGARRLSIDVGWDTTDVNNDGSGNPISKPIERDALTLANITANNFAADGSFEVQATIPGTANGTGMAAIEGHPAEIDPKTLGRTVRVPVRGIVQNFLIDPSVGATITARRQTVDVIAKCDRCHQLLSLHGSNRSDEGALCPLCHNPNNTDFLRRAGVGIDGKLEESIDFKRMIHAIHAAAETNFDGTQAHGFRKQGIVIYGFGGSPNDFSHLRFPGALDKCETCHVGDSWKLQGIWEQPAQNGILGSTINSAGGDLNHANHLKISPTAAVCSACHDSAVAQSHMILNGALFGAPQSMIATNVESCAVCHAPGKIASVELVHQGNFGEDIP